LKVFAACCGVVMLIAPCAWISPFSADAAEP
jgi:hypothetical protein